MKIRRGCTDDIEINLFMVDHVCMSEGGGKGKMCFCEENECNAANNIRGPTPVAPLAAAATALAATLAAAAAFGACATAPTSADERAGQRGGGGSCWRSARSLLLPAGLLASTSLASSSPLLLPLAVSLSLLALINSGCS